MKVTINLKPLKELLSSEDRWCKDSYAKTIDNSPVLIGDPRAYRFCLEGAIVKIYAHKREPWFAKYKTLEFVKKCLYDYSTKHNLLSATKSLLDFNDKSSHKEIVEFLNSLPDEYIVEVKDTNQDENNNDKHQTSIHSFALQIYC